MGIVGRGGVTPRHFFRPHQIWVIGNGLFHAQAARSGKKMQQKNEKGLTSQSESTFSFEVSHFKHTLFVFVCKFSYKIKGSHGNSFVLKQTKRIKCLQYAMLTGPFPSRFSHPFFEIYCPILAGGDAAIFAFFFFFGRRRQRIAFFSVSRKEAKADEGDGSFFFLSLLPTPQTTEPTKARRTHNTTHSTTQPQPYAQPSRFFRVEDAIRSV